MGSLARRLPRRRARRGAGIGSGMRSGSGSGGRERHADSAPGRNQCADATACHRQHPPIGRCCNSISETSGSPQTPVRQESGRALSKALRGRRIDLSNGVC
jgi:hypothetical protein